MKAYISLTANLHIARAKANNFITDFNELR